MKRPRFIKAVPNNGNDDPLTVKYPEDGHTGTTVSDNHDKPVYKKPRNPRETPSGILPDRWDK